ncbi:hypothetical protein FIBSPDRAFT_1037679 [Athelia psychrophila]|uniref:Uncharacterized protein n=1 Tax=Athelia psychrophila TaxID=1759441 RepID=A0A166U1N6_9AGAM|nr:hypothetical protein FIBSPDRAFT_1037679 [Fibularhizoctonia sp. CBS 109695]
MATIPTADSMLAEIQSETLNTLLTSVRWEVSPPGSTQIHALDAQFFSSMQHHQMTHSSLNGGDLIEVQGPPASGKTHFLYHLIVTSILPSTVLGIHLSSWDKAAVIFDTDGTFSLLRLRELLLSRLGSLLRAASQTDNASISLGDITKTAMARVHVFRPTSSVQLAASLLNLPSYHAEHLPGDVIGIVAVDSVSSFYWPDRFTVEQMNSGDAKGRNSSSNPLHHFLTSLQKIRASHGPVVVLTNWGLNPLTKLTRDSAPTMLYKQHLNPFPNLAPPYPTEERDANSHRSNTSLWNPSLTHHITLPFVPMTPFIPDASIQEVQEQEMNYRKEIVDRGEVAGIVRTSGCARTGRFTFRVCCDEVVVDSEA